MNLSLKLSHNNISSPEVSINDADDVLL